MTKKLISLRVDEEQLQRLGKALGVDDSKAVRACMNLAENVIRDWFGGQIGNIFKRKKSNEELDLYDNL